MSEAAVRLVGLRKVFGGHGGTGRRRRGRLDRPRGRRRRVLRDARSVGLGQDHRAADDRRLRDADRRHGRARRPRRHPTTPPFDRDVNTVFQDYALFPHMTVRAERRLRPDGQEGRQGASGCQRADEALATVRLEGFGDAATQPALRWPAAAGGARPRAGQPAQGAAARRAARRARPQAARADAGRAQGDPARRRHHLPVRDPRPGGGADDERPDRRVQRRPRSSRSGRRGEVYERPGVRRSSPASSARRTCCRATPRQRCSAARRRLSVRPEKIRIAAPGEAPRPAPATITRRGHGAPRSSTPARRPAASCGSTPGGELSPSGRTTARQASPRPRGDRVQSVQPRRRLPRTTSAPGGTATAVTTTRYQQFPHGRARSRP